MILKVILVSLALSIFPTLQDKADDVPIAKVVHFESDIIHDYYSQIIPKKYLHLIFNASGQYHIPLYILVALVWSESRFSSHAINVNYWNGTEDYGLMQLNSSNYEGFKYVFNEGKNFDWFDPATNIRLGCSYLQWLHESFSKTKGSWYRSLVFWNGGGKSSANFAKFILCIS